MEFVLGWVLLAVAVAFWAGKKGRGPGRWLLFALLLSPLLAGVFLAIADDVSERADHERCSPLTHVRCPDCRELVRKDARKCKHCGTALLPDVSCMREVSGRHTFR